MLRREVFSLGVLGLGLNNPKGIPNIHILAQSQYYNYYYPKPKYLIIGYMDPSGNLVPFSVVNAMRHVYVPCTLALQTSSIPRSSCDTASQ